MGGELDLPESESHLVLLTVPEGVPGSHPPVLAVRGGGGGGHQERDQRHDFSPHLV